MRYILLFPFLLSFLLCTSPLEAQGFGAGDSYSDHLSFKGVPITGTVGDMVQQLRERGCSYSGSDKLTLTDGKQVRLDKLWGSLVGFDNVLLTLWSTVNSPNYVFQCTAAFPVSGDSRSKWIQIMDIYSKVVEKLGRKYGTPTQVNHYCPGEGDFIFSEEAMKYRWLRKGKANWYDAWVTENGEIRVELEYQGVFAPDANSQASEQNGVVISWTDSKSLAKAENSELDEL